MYDFQFRKINLKFNFCKMDFPQLTVQFHIKWSDFNICEIYLRLCKIELSSSYFWVPEKHSFYFIFNENGF